MRFVHFLRILQQRGKQRSLVVIRIVRKLQRGDHLDSSVSPVYLDNPPLAEDLHTMKPEHRPRPCRHFWVDSALPIPPFAVARLRVAGEESLHRGVDTTCGVVSSDGVEDTAVPDRIDAVLRRIDHYLAAWHGVEGGKAGDVPHDVHLFIGVGVGRHRSRQIDADDACIFGRGHGAALPDRLGNQKDGSVVVLPVSLLVAKGVFSPAIAVPVHQNAAEGADGVVMEHLGVLQVAEQ